MTKPNIDTAYAAKDAQANKDLYANWAATYDEDFAAGSGYALPANVARVFLEHGAKGLVLDVGFGTVLFGEHLSGCYFDQIDGVDISPDMLAEAALKDVYERLFEGDLLGVLDVEDATYDGLVSAGTFTLGHVGPAAFDELLRITRPGGLLAISVNAAHYAADGFAAKLDELSGQIAQIAKVPVPIYAKGQGGTHEGEACLVLVFKKL